MKKVDEEFKKVYHILAEVNMDSAFGSYVNKTDVREVLANLGITYNLVQNYKACKSIDTNREHKIEMKDFMRWYLSGRKDLVKWKRFIYYSKWRMQ